MTKEEKKIDLTRIEGSEYCSAKWTAKKLTYKELSDVLSGAGKVTTKDKKQDIEDIKVLMEKYPKQVSFNGLLASMSEAKFRGADLDKVAELVVNGIKLNLNTGDAKETNGN